MNPRFRAALLASFFLVSAVSLAWAQPAGEPGKADKDAKAIDPPKGEPKDPTAPSARLKELLHQEKSGKALATPKMPALALRGRVVFKDQPAVALLEVDGKVFLVGKGTSLPGSNNTMVRVIDVTSIEVRIEVLPFKEMVILR